MNWSHFIDSITPLVLPLTIVAASWTLQGWILVKPRQKKEIGEAILKASKWFWVLVVVLIVIITVLGQLVVYNIIK